MADPYSMVKGGKLKLKRGLEKKKKVKKSTADLPAKKDVATNEDTTSHGGWWECKEFGDIIGAVAIEIESMRYIKSLDNGMFSLGDEHTIGESPDAEEILTAIKISDKHIALKSGYGKYLGVQVDGKICATAEAISSREQWEPVFENGKVALAGHNDRFLSFQDGGIYCCSKKASENEFLHFRSCSVKKIVKDEDEIMSGRMADVEMNYVKKYQSFEDKRVRVCKDDRKAIKKAKLDGNLHETLLDRRSKMKADKFC